jgi:uncharacterized protein (TIGR02147 family)
MTSVFEYTDYRKYLSDWFAEKKRLRPSFSYTLFARKAGFNDRGFLHNVIHGKRDLTKESLIKVSRAIGHAKSEAEYFENLVFFNQAKTIAEKNHFFERLVEKQRHRSVATIREDQFEYFSEWYHCVLRELVCMVDFKDDVAKLAKYLHPAITPREAAKSIKLLLRLGFLKKVSGGYRQTQPLLSTGYGLTAHHVVNFQIAMLHKAIEAFDRCKPDQRLTSATTLAVSRQTYEKMVEKIRTVRSELLELARGDGCPDRVYELTVNLFPLTITGRQS